MYELIASDQGGPRSKLTVTMLETLFARFEVGTPPTLTQAAVAAFTAATISRTMSSVQLESLQ